eukprot:2868709-Pyramimonas_sp.AAC.1
MGALGISCLPLGGGWGLSHGATKKGRCLSSLLDIRTPGYDPGISIPVSCLKEWLRAWIHKAQWRPGIRRAWNKVVEHFQSLDPS